jgi:3-oxoacyl-[acyl-carrier-protein] synthase II
MRLEIKGAGWVTSTGVGLRGTGGPLVLGAGALPKLKSRELLGEVHKRFGRFDSYTKAGFSAIALALRDAGMDRWRAKRPVGLIVSTQRGCLAMDTAYFATVATEGGALASPNLFAYTLPTCVLGEAAIQFGLTGPAFVVDDASPGHLGGIRVALDLLQWDLCETVVAGWCDVPSEVVDSQGHDCGAVFIVLDKQDVTSSMLTFDNGVIRWNGMEIDSLEQLVNSCSMKMETGN